MKLHRELILFAFGGVLGFAVDAGIVQWLVRGLHWNPYVARLLSFAVAATVTWWWNRSLTFAQRLRHRAHAEWLRWMVAMGAGAGINYGVYALLIWWSATVRGWPLIGVAAGSALAAAVNFTSARTLVFNKRRNVL